MRLKTLSQLEEHVKYLRNKLKLTIHNKERKKLIKEIDVLEFKIGKVCEGRSVRTVQGGAPGLKSR